MPALPDPGSAATLDDIVERLRSLQVWAGDPSYGQVTGRVNAAWTAAGRPTAELVGRTTVVDCFRPGRRRLNVDLVVAVVAALHPETAYVAQWQQALRVVGGRTGAAAHALTARIGDRNERARAHAGLGRAYRRQRRPGRARRQLRLARGLHARLGAPEAARLTALPRAGRRGRYPAR